MPLADITPISPLFFTIPYLVIIGLVNFAKKMGAHVRHATPFKFTYC